MWISGLSQFSYFHAILSEGTIKGGHESFGWWTHCVNHYFHKCWHQPYPQALYHYIYTYILILFVYCLSRVTGLNWLPLYEHYAPCAVEWTKWGLVGSLAMISLGGNEEFYQKMDENKRKPMESCSLKIHLKQTITLSLSLSVENK